MKKLGLALDPSFTNTGAALFEVDTEISGVFHVLDIRLIQTAPAKEKMVRKSSDDFARAQEIAVNLKALIAQPVSCVIAELPHGSQSARSSWALGITVGILATFTTMADLPCILVSEKEVKRAVFNGGGRPTKEDMIEEMIKRHPNLRWLPAQGKARERSLWSPKNEHLADAIATIYAGQNTHLWRAVFTG